MWKRNINFRTVQVDPNPTTPVASNQINLCGGTAFLSANTVTGSNVGIWTLASGSPTPSIGSAVSSSTSISGLISPNSYAYVWNVSYTGSSCPTKEIQLLLILTGLALVVNHQQILVTHQ